MSESAEYFIAQFLADPMRREPRNVGVVVLKNGECAATFLGELESPGRIDKRRLKKMPNPDIYERWVRYWREQIERSTGDVKERLIDRNGGNYDIVEAGFVTDTGDDSAKMVCEYLYSNLVLGGELAEGETSSSEAETSVRAFRHEISMEFRKLDILGSHYGSDVRHPILAETSVLGKLTAHTPAYYQQNGAHYVMEAVNFTTPRKNPAKERAGWAARMFEDIHAKDNRTIPIALIRATAEDLKDKTVEYALKLLPELTQIVNWNDTLERQSFLREREQVARSEVIDLWTE